MIHLSVRSHEVPRLLLRMRKPISDEEALAIGKEFDAPSLFEHVARARRRVVGAMFPTDIA